LRSAFAPYVDKAHTAETPNKPRTSKHREARRQRQENKQLTEQIRVAAQRTREQQKAQEQREKTAQSERESVEQDSTEPPALHPAALDPKLGPATENDERNTPATPPVPVPAIHHADGVRARGVVTHAVPRALTTALAPEPAPT
jgi:hypothetical protein